MSILTCLMVRGFVLAVVAATALFGSAACGSAADSSGFSNSAPSGPSATASSSSPPADPRCGPPAVPGTTRHTITSLPGVRMPAVRMGRGSTVAVFLHQTDGDGMCGFWPYAAWATARHHFAAVLVDLCGYGEATCSGRAGDDQLAQVDAVVSWARTFHPTRVVLVGASMGGALALAAATRSSVDAVVDLSGPSSWIGAEAARYAPRVRVPTLIAVSPGDPSANYADLRKAFASIPVANKRFVRGDGLHGWDMLLASGGYPPQWNAFAGTVAQWIVAS